MKLITKKVIAFTIGCAFGAHPLFFESIWSIMTPSSFSILDLPGEIGLLMSRMVFRPICKLDTSICSLTGFFGGMIIGYGIIFLLIYLLYLKVKRQKIGGCSE